MGKDKDAATEFAEPAPAPVTLTQEQLRQLLDEAVARGRAEAGTTAARSEDRWPDRPAICPACGSDKVLFATGGGISCASCKTALRETRDGLKVSDETPTHVVTSRTASR